MSSASVTSSSLFFNIPFGIVANPESVDSFIALLYNKAHFVIAVFLLKTFSFVDAFVVPVL
jgi:hypothetical protein